MARTETHAYTETFTRTDVLAFQIGLVVEGTTGSDTAEEILRRGIVENQWIEVVGIDGLDHERKIQVQVIMRIDWERHQFHVVSGHGSISIDERISKEKQPSYIIQKLIQFFSTKVDERDLTAKWWFRCNEEGLQRIRHEFSTGPYRNEGWAEGEVVPVISETSEYTDELTTDLALLIPKGPPDARIQKHEGRVKWFSDVKGFGFIVPDNPSIMPLPHKGRDIFVHYSHLLGVGFRTLAEGQRVRFSIAADEKGVRALNVEVFEQSVADPNR